MTVQAARVNSFYEAGGFGPTMRVAGYYRGVAVVQPGQRFLSAAIDLAPLISLQILYTATMTIVNGQPQLGPWGVIATLLMVGYIFFNHVYLVAKRGQTLGKMALGHHIVHVRYDDEGWWFTRMNWKLAWLRAATRLLDIAWLPISILKMILSYRRTAICDSIANTVVVPYQYYWEHIPNERFRDGYSDREG